METSEGQAFGRQKRTFLKNDLWKLVFAYVLLLAVLAYLGRWTPEYLEGRDLAHFMVTRMIAAAVMLGVLASFIRLVPAALLLAAFFLFVGTISAIKREATGEPFQISDVFLARHSPALLGYVGWADWLAAAALFPALLFSLKHFRFRLWSAPLFSFSIALLCTYRFEPVVDWIHDNSYWIGVENLTFSQAESERMNGLATHLYFSTAGLRLKTYAASEVEKAMAALNAGPSPARRASPAPDIFIVLGEAWWRDPSDGNSPLDRLTAAGFSEGTAISPVYGGTTPNAEFELLTGIPMKSFRSGIIPYQHYLQYLSEDARSLPRLLAEQGYVTRAYHNFDGRFWLRDQVYPRLGFASFDSMETMDVIKQDNGWPKDAALFARAFERLGHGRPEFHYIVTVQTHGPFTEDKASDIIGGERHPGITDYRARLSDAVDQLLKFDAGLRARGRPYLLYVFGDHLPGTRLHQWKMGWKDPKDARLHQVPFLIFSNGDDAKTLRDRLDMRPLTCVAPVLADGLSLGIDDRYFRHVAKVCDGGKASSFVPDDAVIQNQMFSPKSETLAPASN